MSNSNPRERIASLGKHRCIAGVLSLTPHGVVSLQHAFRTQDFSLFNTTERILLVHFMQAPLSVIIITVKTNGNPVLPRRALFLERRSVQSDDIQRRIPCCVSFMLTRATGRGRACLTSRCQGREGKPSMALQRLTRHQSSRQTPQSIPSSQTRGDRSTGGG